MIPGGFQYFLDDFWNFQNVHQIWTRAPCMHHQKITPAKNPNSEGNEIYCGPLTVNMGALRCLLSFNCQHECNEGFVKPVAAAAVPGAPAALVALAAAPYS